MNGIAVVAGPPGLWQEARNADGRVYYYNTQTKATQWTKPIELMTPAEVISPEALPIFHRLMTISGLCRINHGRSTQQREEGNTGISCPLSPYIPCNE